MHWEPETWGIISTFVLRQIEGYKSCAEIADRRACHLLLLLLGTELPLMVESFGLHNNIFPFPSILDAGYPVF